MLTTTNHGARSSGVASVVAVSCAKAKSFSARASCVAFLDDSRVSGWQALDPRLNLKILEAPKNANGHERGVRLHPASPAQIVTVQATEPLRAQHRRLCQYGGPDW
jgi:hypothetical protein